MEAASDVSASGTKHVFHKMILSFADTFDIGDYAVFWPNGRPENGACARVRTSDNLESEWFSGFRDDYILRKQQPSPHDGRLLGVDRADYNIMFVIALVLAFWLVVLLCSGVYARARDRGAMVHLYS